MQNIHTATQQQPTPHPVRRKTINIQRFGFLDSYVAVNTVFKNKIRNFAAPNLRTVNLYSQNLDERTFHVSFLRQYTRIVLSFFQIPKQSI